MAVLTDQQIRDMFAQQFPQIADSINGRAVTLDSAAYQARLDQWVQGYKEARQQRLAALVREVRRRLDLSDWTMLPDSGLDRTAWAAYRTALRQLVQDAVGGNIDPDNPPDWPAPPADTPLRPVV